MATAVVTGASSGIGRDIALMLAKRGYDIVLVSRDKAALQSVAKHIETKVTIAAADLSVRENCYKLYEQTKDLDVEILVNNAGFGVFGEFAQTPLDKTLNMLDLNVGALHTLTRLYLDDMRRKNKGFILNVASLAAFGSGPLLAAYYAGKAYVYRLSTAIAQELRAEGSNVHISVLCPGPVATKFNDRAGVEFSIPPMTSRRVAACALKGMFRGKEVIIPGFTNKLAALGMKFAPLDTLMNICYKIQHKKLKNKKNTDQKG